MNQTQALLDLKEKIETDESNLLKTKGKLEEQFTSLEKNYDLKTVAQAKKENNSLTSDINALGKALDEGVEELEELLA